MWKCTILKRRKVGKHQAKAPREQRALPARRPQGNSPDDERCDR